MEVCVIAKCTYKLETIMFSVSAKSSMVDVSKTFCLRLKRASAKPLLSNEWEMYIHHVGQKFDGGVEEFWLKLCKIRAKPKLKPVEIINEFKDYYSIDISYYHAWFDKELAKQDVHGDKSKSFNKLVWYADTIKETNNGFLYELECEVGINRFRWFLVPFGGSIAGFQYCITSTSTTTTFTTTSFTTTTTI
ncbi:hypothetical protein L3X38_041501 [Prunus dulcis]|uniref:Uncharacterized protein n=1 Tax=Prunus dulcis TaxID=3755 RepID=A0AAD4UU50_PRUDU|nr:hypothetical protein L3X38_041501 [Prunus dulcis]